MTSKIKVMLSGADNTGDSLRIEYVKDDNAYRVVLNSLTLTSDIGANRFYVYSDAVKCLYNYLKGIGQ